MYVYVYIQGRGAHTCRTDSSMELAKPAARIADLDISIWTLNGLVADPSFPCFKRSQPKQKALNPSAPTTEAALRINRAVRDPIKDF